MNILIIAAHPDDEVYGMGGTMSKLAAQGHEVHVLVITDGSTAQYRNEKDVQKIVMRKQEEAQKANSILGVKNVHFGKLPDMKLDQIPHIKLNQVIEDAIRKIEPCEVYTHFYGDVNLDHQMVYKSTLVATRPIAGQCVKRLYAYRVPSSTEWLPQMMNTNFMINTYSDISEYVQAKDKAILTYATELREYPHPRSLESVRQYDLTLGLTCGLKASEGFMLLRSLV